MFFRLFLVIIMLSSFSALSNSSLNNSSSEEINTCHFFGEYGEFFYIEKNNKKSKVKDALEAVNFVVGQSPDYQSMDIYEKTAFNSVIKDLANQIYIDDSKNAKEAKGKAIAYCEHNKREVKRTQLQRISYCQRKGSTSEMVFQLAKDGISENELLSNVEKIGEKHINEEYVKTINGISEAFKLYKSNPNIESKKVGEMVYKDCLLKRG
jgi:SOS response regulatory protein OraA/RecX